MTLKEKFKDADLKATCFADFEINYEKIVDEIAIGFAEWVNNIRTYKSKVYCLNSYEELLEMYKKEKGL